MKARYYTNIFVEDGRTIQEDVIIDERALNEIVR